MCKEEAESIPVAKKILLSGEVQINFLIKPNWVIHSERSIASLSSGVKKYGPPIV